jgi:hypothetical protein
MSIGVARYVGYFGDVDTRVPALGLLVVVSAVAIRAPSDGLMSVGS